MTSPHVKGGRALMQGNAGLQPRVVIPRLPLKNTLAKWFRLEQRRIRVPLLLIAIALTQVSCAKNLDWGFYGGSLESTHYSPLSQINRANVKQLHVAWTYDTAETGGLQTSPIEVGGVLYGLSPSQKIFAADASTGKLKWKFDSGIASTQPNRGLAYWRSGGDRRLVVGVMNFVYELNAETGDPVSSFGDHGRIDLRENLGRAPATVSIA
ncbi:MAG TPA: hypothetical protein VG498_12540, partial [Terriglobales bacterium]|nr:hypothetical protein [Terriglobales bacterium]